MSKQVYIDSNGNEVQVSGTVNTADMMPMSASDSTKVATAIGDLSTLTTTVKSSLVGAVNEKATVYGLGNIGSTTKTLKFSDTARYFLIFNGASTDRMGLYLCLSRTSSTSYYQDILSSTRITLSSNNNGELVITASASNIYCYLLIFEGSPNDITIT